MSKSGEKPQVDKFKEAAREHGCDDDDQRFKKRLAQIVKQKTGDEGNG